jgi:hypothetical protein
MSIGRIQTRMLIGILFLTKIDVWTLHIYSYEWVTEEKRRERKTNNNWYQKDEWMIMVEKRKKKNRRRKHR